ncbi:GNAT family N-acetyltransferase [Luteolibacter marinus]|uniref:GNAT family N-acetyltransferase n=1 Tax=Luteolibacter marinus TaxID=2776705 RepID=UPI0018691F7D|nr:GNAT family protein [Luteolibacter marinus]
MKVAFPDLIETERLIVRPARPGDGAVFNRAIHESLDQLRPWLGWVSPPPTPEESEDSCRRAHEKFLSGEDLMAFFFLKEGGAMVGGSGLHDPDWELRCFEVGYWGRSGHGGRGLVTEGVRALAEFALSSLGARRVFLTTDQENRRSWRLAENAGFELEGILRNERLNLAGMPRDTRVYSRVPA